MNSISDSKYFRQNRAFGQQGAKILILEFRAFQQIRQDVDSEHAFCMNTYQKTLLLNSLRLRPEIWLNFCKTYVIFWQSRFIENISILRINPKTNLESLYLCFPRKYKLKLTWSNLIFDNISSQDMNFEQKMIFLDKNDISSQKYYFEPKKIFRAKIDASKWILAQMHLMNFKIAHLKKLPSRRIPTFKHFLSRQYWHWFLWCWSIGQDLNLKYNFQFFSSFEISFLTKCNIWYFVWYKFSILYNLHFIYYIIYLFPRQV